MEIKFNTHWIAKKPEEMGNCTVMEVGSNTVTLITDWGNIVSLSKDEFLSLYYLNTASLEYEKMYEALMGEFPEDRLFRYKLEDRIALLQKALRIYDQKEKRG